MRRLPLLSALLLVLLAPALLYAGLGKYKDWGSSPQALFMTEAERDQWAAINTEADAEQFVNRFLAARKPDFAAEITKRAEMADKYLTVGKTPGSKTLRGKIIIFFGPPSDFNIIRRVSQGEHSGTTDTYSAAASSDSRGGGTGQSVSDMTAVAQREGMSGKEILEYSFRYSGDKLPTPRSAALNVAVDVDATGANESLADRGQRPEIDELFSAAAGTWLVKAAPAKP